MKLSQASEGFILSKSVEGLSIRTLVTYEAQLKLLIEFLGDPDVEAITTDDLRRFFHYLRHEYRPTRWGGGDKPLTGRTIHNYWICFKSFYTWGTKELGLKDAIGPIPAPKAEEVEVEPFTEQEVKAMLKEAGKGRYPLRNIAMILVLLDTGIRSSEFCNLAIADLDPKTGKLKVFGKGSKYRTVYLGVAARKAVWRYLVDREDRDDPGAPLFATYAGVYLRDMWLRGLIRRIGNRAGVKHAHPHKFRHTFATNYLRNGGDIFTLQRILGHSTLKMVRRYAKIADTDIESMHRRASPADNWLLGRRSRGES